MSTPPAPGARVVMASMLGLALSPGTIVFYTLGVFMDPVAASTGWSRSEISFAASVFTAVLIVAIPVLGSLLDRFGVRRVLLPSVALFGLGLIGIGAARSLWQWYLAYAGVAACGAGANSLSYMRAVCTRYDRHRGLAIAIAQAGMGIGVMLMPMLVQALLKHGGWSFAYEMLGGIVLLVSLPTALWVTEARSPAALRQPAASAGANANANANVDGDTRPAAALRQFRFWALAAGFFFWAGAINSTALQLVPLIQSTGTGRATALKAASVFGAAMLLGRIGTGLLIDRYFAPLVAAALVGISTIAIGMLAHGLPGELALVAAFLVGISAGSDGDLLSYLVAKYFGMRSFATLSSLVFSVYLVGTSIFPWLTGWLAGRYGGYGVPMLICTALGVGCVASMLLFAYSCREPLPTRTYAHQYEE